MSIAKKLKSSNRKTIALQHQRDPETGQAVLDDNGNPLTLTIRRVNAQEVLLKAGGPVLLNLFGGLKSGESTEQQQDRMQAELFQDNEKLKESAEFYMRLVNVTVAAGVVDVPIVNKPESELEEDEITPGMLGDDLPYVFNKIAEFSGIPFSAQEVAATQRFPKEQVATDSGPDGAPLRSDPVEPGAPNAG